MNTATQATATPATATQATTPADADRPTERAFTALWVALLIVGQASLLQFLPFLADHGVDVGLMWDDMTATRMSTGVLLDLAMSSVALWAFMTVERRVTIAQEAVVVVANLVLGLSFALPLYLLLRTRPAVVRDVARG